MAGGKGERFWPLSSESRPKQLLSITDDKCMLEVTIERIDDFIPIDQTIVVAGENIKDAILVKCPLIKDENMLCEPHGRNTCLAIGLAAIHLQQRDPEGIMVVLSADHLIEPAEKLVETIKAGTKIAAKQDNLITIGIVPSRAETGYGYIELSDEKYEVDGISVCKVSAFKEKPRPTVAQQYYYGRKHLWNSGMFIWSVGSILKAFEKHMPEMYQQLLEYSEHIGKSSEKKARIKLYIEAESVSIDVAILEQADNVLTLQGKFTWDDIGSWLALQRFKHTDKENNVVIGQAILSDTFESTIVNDTGGLVAALGVSDLVIVRTGDVLFVAHKTHLDKIKGLLNIIESDEDLRKFL
ncbi:MAG: sugar phosphate nucleotidyltransferase [Candidatus Zixiibacteriota bacterium]